MEEKSLKEALTILTSDDSEKNRTTSYSTLACCLKSVGSNIPIPESIFNQRNKLIHGILTDMTPETGLLAPYALQALGYILFNELLARCVEDDLAAKIVTALLNVTISEESSKQIRTRALWCLANQNMQSSVISSRIDLIVSTIKKLATSPFIATVSVALETLAVLMKLYTQCKAQFLPLYEGWYSVLFCTLLSKQVKVQSKALEVSSSLEESLIEYKDISNWLHKELKKNVLQRINSIATSKSFDPMSLLKVWMHFVRILGKTLHKSGAFLNDMLKIVEIGFKSRYFVVQLTAYEAWKVLIDDFALDEGVLTNSKRLQLLLMPLLASGSKGRSNEVDKARVSTWWYLIVKLLSISTTTADTKIRIFKEVCIPFLLFCIGLDPKVDLSVYSAPSSTPYPTPSSLYALLSATNPDIPIPHYPFTPTSEMVNTACSALTMFLGSCDPTEVTGSIITGMPANLSPCRPIPKGLTLSLMVFIEGCVHNKTMFGVSSRLLSNVIYHTLECVINPVGGPQDNEEDGALNRVAIYSASDLMLRTMDTLSIDQLSNLIQLFASCRSDWLYTHDTPTQGVWSNVLSVGLKLVFFRSSNLEPNMKIIEKACIDIMTKVAAANTSEGTTLPSRQVEDAFSSIIHLVNSLVEGGTLQSNEGGDPLIVYSVWAKLAHLFTNFLMLCNMSKTSLDCNSDFRTIRQLLIFPFKHGFIQCRDIELSAILDVWKSLYSTARVFIGLLIKDPNVSIQYMNNDFTPILTKLTINPDSCALKLDRYIDVVVGVVSVLLNIVKTKSALYIPSFVSVANMLTLCLKKVNEIASIEPTSGLSKMDSPFSALTVVSELYDCPLQGLSRITGLINKPLSLLLKKGLYLESAEQQWKSKFLDRCIRVWRSISQCLRRYPRYKDQFSTKGLQLLSPLLEEILLLCRNEEILKITVDFWNDTFGKVENLVYPDSLRKVLTLFSNTYKAHVLFPLPGFIPVPDSELVDMPELIDPSFGKPIEHDSEPVVMLPRPCSSPLRYNITSPQKSKSPIKKKNLLKEHKAGEYVVIDKSSSKDPKPLTQHQKDKLQERPVIPAMYTSVDPSLSTQPFDVAESFNDTEPAVASSQVIPESPPSTAVPINETTSDHDSTNDTSVEPMDIAGNKQDNVTNDEEVTNIKTNVTKETDSNDETLIRGTPVPKPIISTSATPTIGTSGATLTSKTTSVTTTTDIASATPTIGTAGATPTTNTTSVTTTTDTASATATTSVTPTTSATPTTSVTPTTSATPVTTSTTPTTSSAVPAGDVQSEESIPVSSTVTPPTSFANCINQETPLMLSDVNEVATTPTTVFQNQPSSFWSNNVVTPTPVIEVTSNSTCITTSTADVVTTPPNNSTNEVVKDTTNSSLDTPTISPVTITTISTIMTPIKNRTRRGRKRKGDDVCEATAPAVMPKKRRRRKSNKTADSMDTGEESQDGTGIPSDTVSRKRRICFKGNQVNYDREKLCLIQPSSKKLKTSNSPTSESGSSVLVVSSPNMVPPQASLLLPPTTISPEQLTKAIRTHLQGLLDHSTDKPNTNTAGSISSSTPPDTTTTTTTSCSDTQQQQQDPVPAAYTSPIKCVELQLSISPVKSVGGLTPSPPLARSSQPILSLTSTQPKTTDVVSTSVASVPPITTPTTVLGTSMIVATPITTPPIPSNTAPEVAFGSNPCVVGDTRLRSLSDNVKLLKSFLDSSLANQNTPSLAIDDNGNPLEENCDKDHPLEKNCGDGRPLVKNYDNGCLLEENCDNGHSLVENRDNGRPLEENYDNGRPLEEDYDNGRPLEENCTTVSSTNREGSIEDSMECSHPVVENSATTPIDITSTIDHPDTTIGQEPTDDSCTAVSSDIPDSSIVDQEPRQLDDEDDMEVELDASVVTTPTDIVDSVAVQGPGTVCGVSSEPSTESGIMANESTESGHLVSKLAHLATLAVDKYELERKDYDLSKQNPVNVLLDVAKESLPNTPPQEQSSEASPKVTPIGILKHISQFDTPLSAAKVRKVQFASPVVKEKHDIPATPTSERDMKPIKNRRRKNLLSSRRTLQLSTPLSSPVVIGPSSPLVTTATTGSSSDKTTSITSVSGTTTPIAYPSLTTCQSPVEQILPALSPSGKFSNGLYNLVHARNISTIGNLSSLTEAEVQGLPIRSPKLFVLRSALRNFESKITQQVNKKKSSGREETLSKQTTMDELPSQNDTEDPLITLSTPDSQVTGSCHMTDGQVMGTTFTQVTFSTTSASETVSESPSTNEPMVTSCITDYDRPQQDENDSKTVNENDGETLIEEKEVREDNKVIAEGSSTAMKYDETAEGNSSAVAIEDNEAVEDNNTNVKGNNDLMEDNGATMVNSGETMVDSGDTGKTMVDSGDSGETMMVDSTKITDDVNNNGETELIRLSSIYHDHTYSPTSSIQSSVHNLQTHSHSSNHDRLSPTSQDLFPAIPEINSTEQDNDCMEHDSEGMEHDSEPTVPPESRMDDATGMKETVKEEDQFPDHGTTIPITDVATVTTGCRETSEQLCINEEVNETTPTEAITSVALNSQHLKALVTNPNSIDSVKQFLKGVSDNLEQYSYEERDELLASFLQLSSALHCLNRNSRK